MGLHTELFYAIIPTLFLCFLLIPTSCNIFNGFHSCSCHIFYSGRCIIELKFKKKKKEKHFGCPATFWFGTFAMLFSATGCVVCHENTTLLQSLFVKLEALAKSTKIKFTQNIVANMGITIEILLVSVLLVSALDILPKGGGGVWYSCIHSNLQSAEFQRHEPDWLSST